MHHGDDLHALRKQYGTPGTGPTGQFPLGKLNEDDEGEITIAVVGDPEARKVILDFGVPVAWIGFTAEQAIELADALIKAARLASGITL